MKKKKTNTKRIILYSIVAIVIVVGVSVLIWKLTQRDGKQSAPTAETSGETADEDTVIPYGDDESDDYDFTGDYFDISTNSGSMTIEKDGSAYNIEITFSEDDSAISVWKMSATYDKARKALSYADATRTDYDFQSEDGSTDTTSTDDTESTTGQNDAYTDGSGYIYMANDNLFWIDQKDDMGAGLMFQKIEDDTTTLNLEDESGSDTSTDDANATDAESGETTEGSETTEGGEGDTTDVTGDDANVTDETDIAE